MPEVESLPRSILFWRSFTHWIGGMGVLVFILAILPMTGGSQMSLMKAESPGPSVSKLMPRVQSTAKILYVIYFFMTVGPTGNFGIFSAGSKIIMIFDMLAGRLEIFPLLLLFVPETWKKF